ncbi:hypothetical protein [Nostoc sphaeroides]|uniref:Uncharacterized protein n=1 Tax=Nostoc sphaeroides CCNUC1 TaxID=2653204 RepID=A0A5P8W9M1_9NOSO|nr:hypothetical protein [Nostoc sphaeroides]MCC5627569.1 hypothetical protein [Nostoc sphaeroides CHAB 2801]QFS49483.1 hypothetical protein GXM_06977 [Nostoc sphaeroides CCNUC1]
MNGKLFKYLGLPCALVMLGNTPSLADTASGTIREYHLNSQVQGRGVCLQMNPTLPTVGGWLCLWKDNPLYEEITDILREGYSARKTCAVTWTAYRGGLADIDWVSCYN